MNYRFSLRISSCAIVLQLITGIGGTTGAAVALAADDQVRSVVVKASAHFDFATDQILPDDRDALLNEVGKMKDVSWQSVDATGHTDSVGSSAYNQGLSQRRAAAVKSYLVSKGLSGQMIRTQGRAAADPVASNATADGRAQNRRTEVEFRGVRNSVDPVQPAPAGQ